MKNIFQKISLGFIVLIIIFLLYMIYLLINSFLNIKIDSDWISIIQNTSGATIIQNTWEIIIPTETWFNNSWIVIEPPSEPRLYLDYIIKYWVWWEDYIAISPTNQPNMNSKAGSENTERMHNYLYSNKIKFSLPDTNKEWYIMFVTSKSVSNISNIFIWLDGLTIWRLDKKQSLIVENKNEFLYKLNEISLIGNNNYRFSKNLSWKRNININAVVGESNNKIEKIIIFFQ
jgi:hypothetical protein